MRVHHVKKARKDHPGGIKKGDSYYWWKFNFGPRMCSKDKPKRHQLTRSSFLSTLWQLEDSISDAITEEEADEIDTELEMLLEECQSSLDNMPYQLQESSESGMLLQERIQGLEEWIDAIYNIDWDSTSSKEAAEIINNANPGIG